jgi:hypothetical protein
MTAATEQAAVPCALKALEGELRAVVTESEKEIGTLGGDFEALARETGVLLETAQVIVGCAESERMASVVPRVQLLGSTARSFIRERLTATAGVLDTVIAEAALLERLAQLTRGQKAIVRETEMLRVLTNIEVARLGEVGAGFQYLAHELDDFSRAVAQSTSELTSHTDERRKAIEETRRTLTVELPLVREEFARIEESLDSAVGTVEATLGQMCQTPVRFKGWVEGIAGEIAGVVAAVQAHDITRQQIEHVYEALEAMAAELDGREGDPGAEDPGAGMGAGADGEMRVGLTIQSYQLRNARETMRGWTAQIRECLEGIARIASTEIQELGPMVLGQESALAAQLTRIERLEQECEAGNAKVQASFAGISGLMQLVSEHLRRSKSVRDRLQLLMFNSIVEASHLGTQADGILEISKTIKRISAAWGEITAQSEAATREIRTLVETSAATLETFSEGSNEALREAQAETRGGLGILREAAECADRRGREIEMATLALQARIGEIRGTGDRLDGCFARLDAGLEGIESARQELEKDSARAAGGCDGAYDGTYDAEAVERRFSSNYTTEIERAVLRAALTGGALPVAQQSFTGNDVELF